MNKKIIAAAIAGALATPMVAAADSNNVVMYGKVRVAVESIDDEMSGADNIQINSKSSRIGFKGTEDLGNGLKAIWKLEYGVKIATNSTGNGFDTNQDRGEFSGDGSLVARNAYVGLAGDWGTLVVGRHDTPLKMSSGSHDIFSDTSADYNNAWQGGLIDLRADGVLAYISPSFSGLTMAAALIPGENNQADGIADAYSVAAMYSNAGIDASIAYEDGDKDIDFLNSFLGEVGVGAPDSGNAADYSQWRVAASYTMDAFRVGAVYANVEFDGSDFADFGPDSKTNVDMDQWNIYGTYTFGNNVLKVRYFDTEIDAKESFTNISGYEQETAEVDGWAIGLDHNFSKRTQAYVLYTDATTDLKYKADNSFFSDSDSESADTSILSVGLNHNF